MPNGTLSQHLQRERGNGLSWPVRFKIVTETTQKPRLPLHIRADTQVREPSSFINSSTHDIKAYDASRVRVKEAVEKEPEENTMYSVAPHTANVRVQKAVDPEVAALLDDSDVSRFGSNVEDLEEGFVVQANLCEDKEDDEEKAHKSNGNNKHVLQVPAYATLVGDCRPLDGSSNTATDVHCVVEKPRVRRSIDEQFDLLERQEYGIDEDNSDYDDYYGDYEENYRAEDESLAKKLSLSLINHVWSGWKVLYLYLDALIWLLMD